MKNERSAREEKSRTRSNRATDVPGSGAARTIHSSTSRLFPSTTIEPSFRPRSTCHTVQSGPFQRILIDLSHSHSSQMVCHQCDSPCMISAHLDMQACTERRVGKIVHGWGWCAGSEFALSVRQSRSGGSTASDLCWRGVRLIASSPLIARPVCFAAYSCSFSFPFLMHRSADCRRCLGDGLIRFVLERRSGGTEVGVSRGRPEQDCERRGEERRQKCS